eukprot:3049581-Rhodomonas_salina.4
MAHCPVPANWTDMSGRGYVPRMTHQVWERASFTHSNRHAVPGFACVTSSQLCFIRRSTAGWWRHWTKTTKSKTMGMTTQATNKGPSELEKFPLIGSRSWSEDEEEGTHD